MKRPVSVVIAAKDSLHYLRRFLPEIVGQVERDGGEGSEVLLFDDASTDGTEQSLAREMPSVRVIRSESTLGYVRARNTAFEQAHNELILSLDSDLSIKEGFIQEALLSMEQPDVFATACRCL